MIVQADWLDFARAQPGESVDLVYVDPPFNTGKARRGQVADYADAWPDMRSYLAWIEPRLRECRRILLPRGSLYLHCDWRASHHLRLLLDEIFGEDCFINHLIWSYGLGGSSHRRFARKHDDILFYSKSDKYYFHPPRVPATSRRLTGQMKKATDVLDIPSLNNMSRERVGYPTQKPLVLLEMLVNAACPPGGIVADFCCGSGTTLVAAKQTGRKYLGCDISEEAVQMTRARLAD